MKKLRIVKRLALLIAVFLLPLCSSTPSGMDAVNSAISGSEGPKASASLTALLATLKGLGYDGVGLEYESDSTLDFLNKLFQSPRVANRKIKLTYTGLALSYDAKHESLTVGGTTDVEYILKYIEKTVPVRPAKTP